MEGKTTVAYYSDEPVIRVVISHADSDDGRDQMLQSICKRYTEPSVIDNEYQFRGLALVSADHNKTRSILHIIPMAPSDYARYFGNLNIDQLDRIKDVATDTLQRKMVKVEEPRERTSDGDEIFLGVVTMASSGVRAPHLSIVDGVDIMPVRGFVIGGKAVQEQFMSKDEWDMWYGALQKHINNSLQYVKMVVKGKMGAYVMIPNDTKPDPQRHHKGVAIVRNGTFIGVNSLGYVHGKDYVLTIYEHDGMSICRPDGSGECRYSTIYSFLSNWKLG